ncbi:hypothetical protein BKA70DRAFT_86478 [Coprinopsis sp. MPI-PUGE-AT-0042]|nr:hypothetical protein BKA70DRAFT_86478 [Coprinopsis sp. MPI-PUGE-AT-0042]
MHGSRQTASPEVPSRRAQPNSSETNSSAQHPPQSQSLPPIRHLHPDLDLPPPGMSQSFGHGPPYDYASSSTGTNNYATHPFPSPYDLNPMKPEASEIYENFDSEDEFQAGGPPKKKRRRQALSCTECKRRKIKCNRAHPCDQCTRRNEQGKCLWKIIEPAEKYVTRAEYNELKERFEQLSHLVHTMARSALPPGSFLPAMAPPPIGPPPVHETHQYQGQSYGAMQPAPPPEYSPHLNGPSPAHPRH